MTTDAELKGASARLKVVPTLKRRGSELAEPAAQLRSLNALRVDDPKSRGYLD